MLANDLIARGYPTNYSVTSGVALTIMILLDVLLIPRYGIDGAALASTVSYFAATSLIVYIYIRLTGNPLRMLIIPQRSDLVFIKKNFGSWRFR